LYEVLINLQHLKTTDTTHIIPRAKLSIALLEHSIMLVIPGIKLKSLRIGGTVYKVPTSLELNERVSISIRWMITAARNRQENGFVSQLTRVIIETAGGYGEAINKRKEMYRTAEANKAFARYRLHKY
jgi:small subunit ribosomal protein S7